MHAIAEPDTPQQIGCRTASVSPAVQFMGQQDVFQGSESGDQLKRLKDKAQFSTAYLCELVLSQAARRLAFPSSSR